METWSENMWIVGCLNLCSNFSPWDSDMSLSTLVLWLWASIAASKEAVHELCRAHQNLLPNSLQKSRKTLNA